MDTTEIRRVVRERAAAVAAKDAKAMVAHNAPDLIEYNLAPPLRQPSAGDDVAPVEKWLATFEGPMSMEVHDLEVTADGSVAFCTSLNRLTATPLGQPESFSLWFRATLGLRKVDGRWLVVHEHESVPFEMDGSLRASVSLQP
ncbi:nuclear transport factor 2 family protein [Actinoplanes sp. NPDC048967]|uniref:nuclear transport factor 2 family protein n=1 Tax=Actinoplanes sp. NPDC048967 TaxID=3155269 RepID=UPI0033DC1ED1